MKPTSLSVLCLLLLLFHTHFSLAKKGGGFGRSWGSKKTSSTNRGSTSTSNSNSNTGSKNNQGSSSQGGYPKQPGGSQPRRPEYPGSYPHQPSGGYHYQYPARGSPYGRTYSSHSGHGGFPGGYINQNPNNKVLSPHYGGSFGYGGYGFGGGSPFSYRVQQMGMYPSDRSRGFGSSAVMAAGGGAMTGMAVGYGLGRFPRPPFQFHSPREEHYYNHYMYKTYGAKSTDTNDYSRDYVYIQPPVTYDSYMDSCMKKTGLLLAENPKPINKPAATITARVVTSAPDTGTGTNTMETNSTAADNSSTSASSPPRPLNQPVANPVPPASQAVSSYEDDDTVSIVEIGYPALIEQMKGRKCLELYMVYSEKYLKKLSDGVQGLEMGWRGLLAVVTTATLMLLNSNMLMLLH